MRTTTLLLSSGLLLASTSCTVKYQDLLRDRDTQIRELNADLADLRAANADLQRRERAARDAATASPAPAAVPASTAVPSAELQRVQQDLSDLDVRYSRGRLSIGIDNTVTFSSGSVALKNSAHSVLRRVANVLTRDFGDRRIYVEGHTDTDPIKKTKGRYRSNRHLSAERADVVADFLVTKGGIDPSQVVVVGFGPYDPRDTGNGKSAKATNRRVEIVVGEAL
ncbi:MAG: OmpA family protein [Planctomycetota bacterium]